MYSNNNHNVIKKLQIFDNQQLFGFVLNENENEIIIYGEKHIKIYNIVINSIVCFELEEIAYKSTNDWILNAIWYNLKQIATITMHNKLILYSITLDVLNEWICNEKCILYSAYLHVNNFDNIIVYAGTVFNQVLIWINDKQNVGMVKTRLKQHKV